MVNRLYIKELPCWEKATEKQKRSTKKDAFFDLEQLRSPTMRKEIAEFIRVTSTQVGIATINLHRRCFDILCRFLQTTAQPEESLQDRTPEIWLRQLKVWMVREGIPLHARYVNARGNEYYTKALAIGYMERLLRFWRTGRERDQDIWELAKLDIPYRANPIKKNHVLNFDGIPQTGIREETKAGIYLNLQCEAIASIRKEMTAMKRFAQYLHRRYPLVQSCRDIDRNVLEEYLVHLKTDNATAKCYRADLTRLRALLEAIAKIYSYTNLDNLFLSRDIPPTLRAPFKTYSDSELKRLNAEIVKMDEQIARLLIIHQMLGTRISDTLTLQTDCLYEWNGEVMIRIRQMKSHMYEKPISGALAALIRKAISYTQEKYGETRYIFVDEKDDSHSRPMQYSAIQHKVTYMIRKKDLRDDQGELFGFTTHRFRRYYGVKLTEMHLDDWTIAKLLGHRSVRNVKYYRRMSNQTLADETRKARNWLSERILSSLDGWEDDYEQVRHDDRRK